MPALVTPTQVKSLVPSSKDDATITLIAITPADLIVTENLSAASLSANRKVSVELYLAAHFLALTENAERIQQRSLGGRSFSETFENKIDFDLRLTRFGQQAILLDTSGILAGMSGLKGAASIETTTRNVINKEFQSTNFDEGDGF